MIARYPEVFTSGRVWVLDRNFPGADRVARMLATGTHLLIRVKSDLALPRIGGFLPDGSYCSYLTAAGLPDSLPGTAGRGTGRPPGSDTRATPAPVTLRNHRPRRSRPAANADHAQVHGIGLAAVRIRTDGGRMGAFR
jgi:hypothetical protein